MIRNDSTSKRRSAAKHYAILGITLLAPALGGSTEIWAIATITVLVGLLLLAAPPKKSLGLIPNICFSGLWLLSLTGFLPAAWFSLPAWRTDLLHLGANLPSTLSPQPWITLQWNCFLLMALAWSYYLLSTRWPSRLREAALIIYAFAILCLSAALIGSFVTKHRIPFWPEVLEYGFFPNRNQTGDVLGIGGAIIYAIGLQSLRENRRYWWLWPISLSLVCWALILNYSRAGIILFFVTALAIHFYWWRTARDRQRPAVAIGGLALLVLLFAINGGATLLRFRRETTEFFSASENLRWSMFRDVVHLIPRWPVFGSGLGNFRPVFAVSRIYSAGGKEAAHPESDWLWSATDLGLLAPLLVVLLVYWWIKHCPPFDSGSQRLLRMGALLGGCAFALHGIFDVSAHRLGALWPALFLGSIALHPLLQLRESRVVRIVFRVLGGLLVLIGLWWTGSGLDMKLPPTTTTLDRLMADSESANANGNYSRAIPLVNEGLNIAPLSWEIYYQRGLAKAGLYLNRAEVQSDFAIARELLPNWPDVPLKEGLVWLALGEEDLAFNIWEEAMRRWPQTACELYGSIFGVVRGNVELRDRWRKLGHASRECLPILLRSVDRVEFAVELDRLLSEDPELQSLSAAELKTLFQTWLREGNQIALADLLKQHPDWQKIGWEEMAEALANSGDYQQAYETAVRFVAQPRLPKADSNTPVDTLLRQFQATGDVRNDGVALVLGQMKAGEFGGAMSNLEAFEATKSPPASIYLLKSQVLAQKREWVKAWQMLLKYESAIHQ